MSKFLKDMLARDLSARLEGVGDCVVANVIGLDSNTTTELRRRLREKDISLMVVKNSLARRATEGTSLGPAFEGLTGNAAVVWGASDFVALVKEVTALDKEEDELEAFKALGGVMDGEKLTPEKVAEISKWPSRDEQLSMLVGQIVGPGAQLVSQVLGPGSQLAGQVKSIVEKGEE
jgi:ribosomal protein L10